MKKKNRIDREQTATTPNETVNKDRSPIIPQRSKLKNNLHIIERPDITQKQKEFISLVLDKNTKMVFLSGPAGTTKSWISIYCALKLLNEKRISDLIYVRSIVESADSKIGYLPGDIDSKVGAYTQPLLDKLQELLPKNEIDILQKEQRITAIPISFLRGLNWNAKFIFADEGQNLTSKELITLITRIGEYSKIIIAGDHEQTDINGKSGFIKIVNSFDDEESRNNGIHVFRFTADDILRSQLVKFIVKKLRNIG